MFCFLQNLVNSVGRITDRRHKKWWNVIHQESPGAVALLEQLERYLYTLAHNMQFVFTQPFDVVHSNMGKSSLNICFILFIYIFPIGCLATSQN